MKSQRPPSPGHTTIMVIRVALLFLTLIVVQAATVPNRFIVELSTEPVATHVGSARASLGSTVAATHRAQILREQTQLRTSLEGRGARVLDQVDTVANALLIEADPGNQQPWANLPNVRKVSPVRIVAMQLDRAVVVNKITDAWAQIGGSSNAGLGIKIAILDTGVDISQGPFRNSNLSVPPNFPLVNSISDTAFTNNKVIVARSYVSLLASSDPDNSARDRVGHGTALATIAAGGTVAGPLATMTGIAPGAWIGSYKIFGTPGINDGSTDDAILKALDDAVKDGMDIVNLSLGSDIVPRLSDDVEVQAVERATQAGVLVVVAAGNNGNGAATIASPGTAPDAIAVGAQENDRTFSASIQATGLPPLLALPGDGPTPSSPITGSAVAVAKLDSSGLACNALPSGSLSNRIALILRGTCFFETKLNNAAAAGAIAAIVYAAPSAPDAISISVGAATLPAEMISNSDGVALQQALAAGTASSVTESFTLSPVHVDSSILASFSAAGPNVDGSIKPDMVAVGDNYYVATQTYDPNGEMYSPDGFILVGGTSFSTPTVAGAAALLKAARPGLTAAQYRSLLINSATAVNVAGAPARVQQAGTGALNAGAALQSTAALYPTSLSFGTGNGFPQSALNLTVTNAGSATDTFTLTVVPTGSSPAPALSANSLQLGAGAFGNVAVSLSASNLPAGGYEGFLLVAGSNGAVQSRVPYWYGVTSTTPVQITDLDSTQSGNRGSLQTDALTFHITDAAGVPIASITPQVTVTAGGGSVVRVRSLDSDAPGLFSVSVRLGKAAGTNTFHVVAGSIAADFFISGQ